MDKGKQPMPGYSAVEPGDDQKEEYETTYLWKNAKVLGIILLYCAIGSQLSVVNKVVVTFIPLPNTILFLQFFTSVILLGCLHYAGVITVESYDSKVAFAFLPLTTAFFALLYAGMEVMKYAPLETFITVKSFTPVLFALTEYLFLGRTFPTFKALLALIGIVVGAALYVRVDAYATWKAYFFCGVFLIAAVTEGLIAKSTIDSVKLNNWTRSYLLNLLSLPFSVAFMLMEDERRKWTSPECDWSDKNVALLLLSCVMGMGMSFATMLIREAISATSVSVVGTCNKFLSEIVNWLIWDKHTSEDGLGAVLIIMISGIFYEQAPLRKKGVGFSRDGMCPCIPRSWLGISEEEEEELTQNGDKEGGKYGSV